MFQALTYPQIKYFHQLTVGLSLSLFALRWVGVMLQAHWPMHVGVRRTSVVIDSCLLIAGASLWWMGGWNPVSSPWLGAKLLLLVVYVLAGSWALKRARSPIGHLVFGFLALSTATYIVGVALQHHPAGWFQLLLNTALSWNSDSWVRLC